MEKINGDHAANPIFLQEGLSHNCHVDPGLTIRQQFAAMAMQGLVTNGYFSAEDVASRAVTIADALIAELNK